MKKVLSFLLPVGITAGSFFISFMGVRHFVDANPYAVEEASEYDISQVEEVSTNIDSLQLFDSAAVKLDTLGVLTPQNACGCPGCCAVSNAI